MHPDNSTVAVTVQCHFWSCQIQIADRTNLKTLLPSAEQLAAWHSLRHLLNVQDLSPAEETTRSTKLVRVYTTVARSPTSARNKNKKKQLLNKINFFVS